nr:MAG TPA: hypothetical protein [Caudoviricetes sp.]
MYQGCSSFHYVSFGAPHPGDSSWMRMYDA